MPKVHKVLCNLLGLLLLVLLVLLVAAHAPHASPLRALVGAVALPLQDVADHAVLEEPLPCRPRQPAKLNKHVKVNKRGNVHKLVKLKDM